MMRMRQEMVVLQATIHDLDDAVELFNSYRTFYGQVPDRDGARQFLFDRLEHRESVLFLARNAATNEAVGFVQLYPLFSSVSMKRVWVLNDLYVKDAYRGQAVGKRLLAAAKAFATATKAKSLELSTHVGNTRAQALYGLHGYVKDEEFHHYYLTLEETVQ